MGVWFLIYLEVQYVAIFYHEVCKGICVYPQLCIYYSPEVRRGEYWGGLEYPVAILPSCLDMKTVALQLHKHEYSWVVQIGNTSEAVLRPQYTPWPSYSYTDSSPTCLGQYNSLG